MAQCKHHDVCGLTDEADPEAGLCILHSRKEGKDSKAFTKDLTAHCMTNRECFDLSRIEFPARFDFAEIAFLAQVDFANTRIFSKAVKFNGAEFAKAAFFDNVTFAAGADFTSAIFKGRAVFGGTTFNESADFDTTLFTGLAYFNGAKFKGRASFFNATFLETADFRSIHVKGGRSISFDRSHFTSGALFDGGQGPPLFTKASEVNFSNVVMKSPDSMSFRHADLRKCRFFNTDLRKVEFTDVCWPKQGARHVVYDEIGARPGERYPWEELERLYRELKQNYDERRNYPRVGDFHYGEKEMQKYNPETPWSLKVFLWLYWLVSGYGERFLRPLLCTLVLLVAATVAYLWWGLAPKSSLLSTKPETAAFLVLPGAQIREVPPVPAPHPFQEPNAWLNALHYSFRVMTLLKPEDLEPRGFAKVVQTLESLLGPLFLALFALAVRQRLKH